MALKTEQRSTAKPRISIEGDDIVLRIPHEKGQLRATKSGKSRLLCYFPWTMADFTLNGSVVKATATVTINTTDEVKID